jgi:hypothetical protein
MGLIRQRVSTSYPTPNFPFFAGSYQSALRFLLPEQVDFSLQQHPSYLDERVRYESDTERQ